MTFIYDRTVAQARATTAAPEPSPLWGTFEDIREHLYNQFQDTPFDPRTGLSPTELGREVEAYLEAHSAQPRVLQKANIFRIVLTRGQIYLDPLDWFAGKLNHGTWVRKVCDGWLEEATAEAREREGDWSDRLERLGVLRAYYLDLGHIAPGWENLLSKGLTGLSEEAGACREQLGEDATSEQLAFYEAVEIVLQATMELAHRFADLARSMISQHPDQEARLAAIARTCDRVPAHPPETLYEALQFAWLMHELV
jgi:hypothetical protein